MKKSIALQQQALIQKTTIELLREAANRLEKQEEGVGVALIFVRPEGTVTSHQRLVPMALIGLLEQFKYWILQDENK